MTAVTARPRAAPTALRTAGPTFVLLGGVPGAGKTTLLDRLRSERPHVSTTDPQRLADRLARHLPGAVPYRWYRPVVHLVNGVYSLALIARGPTPARTALVVHDPATRPRRRWWTGQLARRRGWRTTLVVIDVSHDEALAGQHQRGRVVAAESFTGHWHRWCEQRDRLTAAADAGAAEPPWDEVHVVRRDTAEVALADILD